MCCGLLLVANLLASSMAALLSIYKINEAVIVIVIIGVANSFKCTKQENVAAT